MISENSLKLKLKTKELELECENQLILILILIGTDTEVSRVDLDLAVPCLPPNVRGWATEVENDGHFNFCTFTCASTSRYEYQYQCETNYLNTGPGHKEKEEIILKPRFQS